MKYAIMKKEKCHDNKDGNLFLLPSFNFLFFFMVPIEIF